MEEWLENDDLVLVWLFHQQNLPPPNRFHSLPDLWMNNPPISPAIRFHPSGFYVVPFHGLFWQLVLLLLQGLLSRQSFWLRLDVLPNNWTTFHLRFYPPHHLLPNSPIWFWFVLRIVAPLLLRK